MKKLFLLIIPVLAFIYPYAQGCSDAGFCTIGNLKPVQNTAAKQRVTVGITHGIGDENVYVLTPAIQYDWMINNQWSIQGKLTGNYADGNLGSAAGLGDIFLSGIFSPATVSQWKPGILLAAKIPLNQSNLKENGMSLPMQYQSSLGTVDAIIGFSITNEKWLFATALQQPLTGHNNNHFLPAYFTTHAAMKYPPGNDFNRKADILLRANYNIPIKDKFRVGAGLLGVYHVANDTYVDGNTSNKPIEIAGSKGATLNVTGSGSYTISKAFSIGLLAGAPVIVRDVRPDGLTRSFTITTEFILNF